MTKNIKIRTAYDGSQKDVSFETRFYDDKPSLTKQSFRDECEINNIMRKWKKTGMLEHLARVAPQYGDFLSCTPDSYQEACNIVANAQQSFAALSSDIRARFENNPELFLAFVSNPNNAKELIELGLAVPSSNAAAEPSEPQTEATSSSPSSGV